MADLDEPSNNKPSVEVQVLEVSETPVISGSGDAQRKPHRAYNVYFKEATKKYVLVTIEYDPDTGRSNTVSMEPIADNPAVALAKLNQMYTMKVVKREEK